MSNEERIIQEMYASSIERTIKRLWITVILLIVLLVGSNIAWIVYEAHFEDKTEITQDVDTGSGSAVVNGIGDVYGEGKTNNNQKQYESFI